MDPYEYTPITSARTFRLVNLLPVDTSTSPPTVRVNILEAALTSPIPYDALSYNWAVAPTQKPDRPLIVSTSSGSRRLLIHQPLETALLHLTTATSSPRPIFIDQICINQLDPADKAAQVPLMGDVYTASARVLVWLGPSTPASDDYFRFIRRLNASSPLARIALLPAATFLPIFDAVADPALPVSAAVASDRDAVLALLEANPDFPLGSTIDVLARAWFTRLWTVQEVCLARDAVFLCGDEALCVACFRAGMLFFTLHNAWWLRTVRDEVPLRVVNRRRDVFRLNQGAIRMFRERKAIHGGAGKSDLFDVVVKYHVDDGGDKIGATMPEDRVFGLMGLAREEAVWRGVRVRYGDAVGVYTEFAGLMAGRNADLLLFAQFPKRIPGLPSWVPDWTAALRVPHGYLELGEPAFRAGGAGGEAPRVDPVSGCLVAEGIIVDRITHVGARSLRLDETKKVSEDVDYVSAKRFFDEIDDLVKMAAQIPTSPLHGMDADQLARAAIRLSDFGLTEKHLLKELAPDVAARSLRDVHAYVSRWAQVIVDGERATESHRVGNMIHARTTRPWYWAPPNEMAILCLCAFEPRRALACFARGVSRALWDVASALGASAHMALLTRYLAFRRRFRGFNFGRPTPAQTAAVSHLGLDVDMVYSLELKAYFDHLVRNVGHRLYVTKQGFVGLGPTRARAGDAVAVVLGGSVPHLLRPRGASGRGQRWECVGEAYCEGAMEGELVGRPEWHVEELHLE